ncbi:MAG: hypothetical protein AAF992_18625 [Bacteroidota bacterium]
MRLLIVLLISSTIAGCYSLTHVQQFTAEANQTLAQGTQLQPTFMDICQQRQRIQLIQQGKLTRQFQQGCDLQQQADSTAIQILQALTRYLSSLQLLGSSGRSGYSLAPLGDALQVHPWLEGQGDVVGAYQQLAQISLTGFTESSRRKKAGQLIAQANPAVQTLLDAYRFVLSDLLVESIERQKDLHYFYSLELVDSTQSFIEKKQVIEEFMDQQLRYKEQQQNLKQYSDALGAIGEGHQALYEQRGQLQQQEAIEALFYYTGQLQQSQLLQKF